VTAKQLTNWPGLVIALGFEKCSPSPFEVRHGAETGVNGNSGGVGSFFPGGLEDVLDVHTGRGIPTYRNLCTLHFLVGLLCPIAAAVKIAVVQKRIGTLHILASCRNMGIGVCCHIMAFGRTSLKSGGGIRLEFRFLGPVKDRKIAFHAANLRSHVPQLAVVVLPYTVGRLNIGVVVLLQLPTNGKYMLEGYWILPERNRI
jgi:hypothetical protein